MHDDGVNEDRDERSADDVRREADALGDGAGDDGCGRRSEGKLR